MLLIVLLVPTSSGAAEPASTGAERYTLDHVSWLTGAWVGTGLGGEVDDVIFEPRDGAMMGVFRLTKHDRVVFYEFFLFEETEEGVALRLHHFNPGMTRWEDEPVRFDLIEAEEQRAVFVLSDPTKPERDRVLTYERDGDRLLATLKAPHEDESDAVRFDYRLTDANTVVGAGF
jgi:hypothetical protein